MKALELEEIDEYGLGRDRQEAAENRHPQLQRRPGRHRGHRLDPSDRDRRAP